MFEYIKECVFLVEKGKSDKYETAQILAKVYGNGIVIAYRNGISGVYGWENGQRKGKTRRAVIGNHLNKLIRRRNDFKSQSSSLNNNKTSKNATNLFIKQKHNYTIKIKTDIFEENQP